MQNQSESGNSSEKSLPDETSGGLEKALAVVDDEGERLLGENRIYNVLDYGWSGPDTPSDEYVGLAMWLTDPPFQHDEALTRKGKVVKYEPTKTDEVLLRNGEDFVGMMEFARNSLGMALCYASVENQKYNIFGKAPFWEAVTTGFLWLNIASDRLRDYFLMARFEQDKDAYVKRYKHSNQTSEVPSFAAPFEEALRLEPANKREILSKLVALANELQAYRKDRNRVVYEVASEAAKASINVRVGANHG